MYRAQRIPFVNNINYLRGIFVQISESVRARVIEFFLLVLVKSRVLLGDAEVELLPDDL